MKFVVRRPHQGDKWYDEGDTREARKSDVQHLIDSGVLVPEGQAKKAPKGKASRPPENKTSN